MTTTIKTSNITDGSITAAKLSTTAITDKLGFTPLANNAAALTANKLTTARTISVGGDASGSVSFDGSEDVVLNIAVGSNSVVLGTDTVGDYLASISSPLGTLSVMGSGESAAVTVDLPNTGVNAGTYGSSTQLAALTVDAQGRITSASQNSLSTSNVTEGTNLYYTTARFDTALATKSTTNLAEGTNLYYTDARVGTYLSTNSYATQTYVNTAISNLVDSAPTTLDTLNELAAALGDDANFSTTVTTSLGNKFNTSDFNTTFDTRLTAKYNEGTANGVVFLNGSKAFTTGTALTFNGSDFGVSASVATATLASSGAYSALSFTNSGGASASGLVLVNSSGIMQTRATTQQWTNSDASSEYMRLTSTGLGIGTSSPQTKIQATGSSAGAVLDVATVRNDSSDANSEVGIFFNPSNQATNIRGARISAINNGGNNVGLKFYTGTGATITSKMTLDFSGNLGIGTSSPLSPLDVVVGAGGARRVLVNYDDSLITIKGANNTANPETLRLVADNIRFNTGTTGSGTERMRLDSSGNLGLGVTPSAWNSVYRALQLPLGASLTGRTDTPETLLASNTYRDSGGFKYFGTGSSTAYFQTGGAHSWHVAPSGTAGNAISFTQAMTLDASGNLGVGTTSPDLTDWSGSSRGIQISSGIWAGLKLTGSTGKLHIQSGAGANYIYGYNAVPLIFGTDNIERARIDPSGNFGIGTSSLAGLKLVVKGATGYPATSGTTQTGVLRLTGGTGLYNVLDMGVNESTDTAWIQATRANSLGTYDKLVINPYGGNVGIGETAPASRLHVAFTSNSVDNILQLQQKGNNTASGIILAANDNNGAGYNFIRSQTTGGTIHWQISGGVATSTMAFSTGGSERARITTSGGFSVGTTADPGVGAIFATGNITGFYSSDANLKENIKDVDNALDKVCAIGAKTFDWKDEVIESRGGEDGYFVQKSDFGVIAQDVQQVFPQAVRTRADGTLAVDYEKLAVLSFGAIKELLQRIEALEAK